jgi:HEAT repeat protein
MDEVERLIEAFGSRGRHDHSVWKLDVLMDLGRFDDPRTVAFYVAVIADAEEPPDVRSDALRRLREASLSPDARIAAAEASLHALGARSDLQLRLHAALVLGDFVDIPAALGALGLLAADVAEPIELRYNAFTSVQRAGPTTACLEILRSLSADETLGQSARALLASWGTS